MRLRNTFYTTVVVAIVVLMVVLLGMLLRLMWVADAAAAYPLVLFAVGLVVRDVWVELLGGFTHPNAHHGGRHRA